MTKDGELQLNLEDEIIRDTMTSHEGEVVNPRLRELLGLQPLTPPEPPSSEEAEASERHRERGSFVISQRGQQVMATTKGLIVSLTACFFLVLGGSPRRNRTTRRRRLPIGTGNGSGGGGPGATRNETRRPPTAQRIAPRNDRRRRQAVTSRRADRQPDDFRAGDLRRFRSHHQGSAHIAHAAHVRLQRDQRHHALSAL